VPRPLAHPDDDDGARFYSGTTAPPLGRHHRRGFADSTPVIYLLIDRLRSASAGNPAPAE
jgi:hypothetical protein